MKKWLKIAILAVFAFICVAFWALRNFEALRDKFAPNAFIKGFLTPEGLKIEDLQALPELEILDLVFRLGVDLDSALIAQISQSPYSHVGVIISVQPLLVLHASSTDTQNKVAVSEFADFLAHSKRLGIKRYKIADKAAVVANLRAQVGKDFTLVPKQLDFEPPQEAENGENIVLLSDKNAGNIEDLEFVGDKNTKTIENVAILDDKNAGNSENLEFLDNKNTINAENSMIFGDKNARNSENVAILKDKNAGNLATFSDKNIENLVVFSNKNAVNGENLAILDDKNALNTENLEFITDKSTRDSENPALSQRQNSKNDANLMSQQKTHQNNHQNTDKTPLYCTTLIENAFKSQLDLNLSYTKLQIPLMQGFYLFPQTFWEDEKSEIIYEFKP